MQWEGHTSAAAAVPEAVSAVIHATGAVADDSGGSGTEASSDEEGGTAEDSASDSNGAPDTSSEDSDGGESDSSGTEGSAWATIPTLRELVAMQRADPRLQALRAQVVAAQAQGNGAAAVMRRGVAVVLGDGGALQLAAVGGAPARWMAPAALCGQLLAAAHSVATAGHRGRDQTYQALRRRWYWRGMFRDVQRFVRGCLQCRRRKDSQPVRAGHMVTFNATTPMQDLGVDLVGPLALTDSGNRFVVSMVCRFSRWCEFVAVPDATAETVADAIFNTWCCRFGVPQRIISDRGAQFTSDLFAQLCQRLGTNHSMTSAWHPQTNGSTERQHRTLGTILTALVAQSGSDVPGWDRHLDAAALVMRSISASKMQGHAASCLVWL